VVGTARLDIVTASGATYRSFDYLQPVDAVLASLEELSGVHPVAEEYKQGLHWRGVTYDFGALLIDDTGDAAASDDPAWPAYQVVVTAPALGGLPIVTADGVQVGQAAADVEQAHPSAASRWPADGAQRLTFNLDPVTVALDEQTSDGVQVTWVETDEAMDRVISFCAPSLNYGA
jgi:hypothetical protein